MSKKDSSSKMSYTSLITLGFVAMLIGIGVVLDGCLVYNLPFFTSISASATTGLMTGMLLPFGLGMMALFFFNYRGYDKTDEILAKIMAIGFTIVAMFPCSSIYTNGVESIGLLGLNPHSSNLIHSIGAVVGFASMAYWVGFQMTKGVMDEDKTVMKKWRNAVYRICFTLICFGILWFAIGDMIYPGGPNVWIAEEIILIPAGFACLVKGGGLLKDK